MTPITPVFSEIFEEAFFLHKQILHAAHFLLEVNHLIIPFF